MAEIKTFYNVNNLDLREINFVLNQIGDRIDKLEGLRGTPKFYANVNMNSHKIQSATMGTSSGEVLTADMADDSLEVSSDGLSVKLATESGLTVSGGLAAAAKEDGGIVVDSEGISVDPSEISHSDLADLVIPDDHTQYLLLAGRSGGQTAKGGTGSGDDLTLQTTSHVTKGSYIFSEMTTAGYLKNDVNGVVTGGNAVVTALDVEIFTDTDTLDAANDVAICNKGSAMTLTLPAATGTAKVFYVKNINTGVVTVEGDAAETIDGAANQALSQWDAITVIDYDSGVWAIL